MPTLMMVQINAGNGDLSGFKECFLNWFRLTN